MLQRRSSAVQGGTLLVLLLLVFSGCARRGPVVSPELAGTREGLGIEIVGLRLASAGYMLDFRYKVLDPGQAAPLFDRSARPYLIHEASGAAFAVPSSPKVGPLRQTTLHPEAGRHYFIFFANPAKYVQPGDRVTVVVGNHRFEHLAVE